MTTQQFFNMLGRNIVPIMFVVFATFGWVGKYIKAQQQAKALRREKERRELEGLRTGRIEPGPTPPPARATPPSAQASLEEIAARRRAKMDEMQRRRAGASGRPSVGQPSTSSDVARQELGRLLGQVLGVPSAPTPPRGSPVRTGRPQQQQRRQPPPNAPRPESPQTRSARAPSIRSQTSEQEMAQPSQPRFAPAHDQNAPEFSYAIGANKSNLANRAASRKQRASVLQGTDLRKLFILREVFEKPVSMRDSEF